MMKKNKLIIFMILALLLLVSVPSIFSYFSTFTMTKGSKKIVMQNSTYMKEEVKSWAKNIVVEADDDSDPVTVKVRVFAPEYIQQLLSFSGENWSKDGDFYSYSLPIDGKADTADYAQETSELVIKIDETKLPTDVKDGDDFHIVVVYEATPLNVQGGNN